MGFKWYSVYCLSLSNYTQDPKQVRKKILFPHHSFFSVAGRLSVLSSSLWPAFTIALEASPHVCQCGAKGSKANLFPVLDAISHPSS